MQVEADLVHHVLPNGGVDVVGIRALTCSWMAAREAGDLRNWARGERAGVLAQHTQLVQAAENLPSLLLAMPNTFGELMRLHSVEACRADSASGA